LYQADKGRYLWSDTMPSSHPYPVKVDADRQICRAVNDRWLGVVSGRQCVGKSYTGHPAATAQYQALFQTP